ncbi:toxin-antitoxin system YwqK family antitoxin [Wenyingzhuangia sp. IMCC45574]
MKFYLKIVALCCLWFAACQTKEVRKEQDLVEVAFSELKRNPKNGFMLYKGILFTGVAKSYLANGKRVKALVSYQQGIKHGPAVRWYDNGKVNYKTQYIHGRKQGLTKIWYKSGQLQSEATYFKGVIHGKQHIWYGTGEKQKERNLRYGQEYGIQKAWRKTGILYANYEAVNGRIFGLLGANMCYKVENEKVQK